MEMNNVALLFGNTSRSKQYLYGLIKEKIKPSYCILYVDNKEIIEKEYEEYLKLASHAVIDVEEPILYLIRKNGVEYEIVDDKDINSEKVRTAIIRRKEEIFVYSGYGGQILGKNLFQLEKRFLHIHAGILPKYRGSTTAYYSYLQEGIMGATAIFLDEGIDTGDIITYGLFHSPSTEIDMDYIYEPWIRTQVLIKALKMISTDDYEIVPQKGLSGAETYFIIHPVLKHIALLGMKNERVVKGAVCQGSCQ